MWIFLADSFLSIVQPKSGTPEDKRDELIVRARAKDDIHRVFPDANVIATRNRDYAFRTSIVRAEVAAAMSAQVMNITATNFKDTVKEKDRHDAYLRVWTVMNDFQDDRGHGGLYNQTFTRQLDTGYIRSPRRR